MASKDKTRSTGPRLRSGPNGLPRGQVSEIQRSRMLTAAAEAVEEVGYARLTVAQVIARARVSRKTFYDLFEDREDCFLAVFDQAVEQISALVSEAYAREQSWRDGLRAGVLAMLRFMDDEPGLARICVVEALGAGPRVLKRRTEVIAQLRGVLDQGRSSAGARVARATEESPDVTSEGVIGAVFAVLHSRLLARSREPFTALLGPLMSMIVLPYLGARVASSELTRKPPPCPSAGSRHGAPSGIRWRASTCASPTARCACSRSSASTPAPATARSPKARGSPTRDRSQSC